MKILLISPLPPPAGGIASWTKDYLSSEAINNHEVIFVNTAVQGKRVVEFTKRSIKDEMKRTYKILIDVKKKLRNSRFDIVHLNTSCAKFGLIRDYLISREVKKKSVKLVLHCHCDVNYMIKSKRAALLFGKLCENSDKIFVLNKSSKDYVKNNLLKESVIIPNFINNDNLNLNHIRIFKKNINNILYVGHVVKTKGCDDILKIAKSFKDKNFILVGYLSDEIRLLEKPNNVEFVGEVSKSEVIKYMKNSDVFLFPTHTEGFPNVILEAMSCGLPIISTGVGAIPDMIEDKGGIIVPVKDVNLMVRALKQLEDINLRIDMCEWNIAKVNQSYSLNKVTRKLIDEYIGLCGDDN